MKRLTFLVIVFMVSFFLAKASSPRMVLVEEATNASCAPCAAINPSLQAYLNNNADICIPVVYHAWWPGPSDPMYLFNTALMSTRINYYNISSVPHGVVEGNKYSASPPNIAQMAIQVNSIRGTNSPVTINVNPHPTNGDTMAVEVTVATDSALANVKLRIAVVEYHHYYSNAGNNGETDFYWVARWMLPNPTGVALTMSAGQTQTFNYSYIQNSTLNNDKMHIVAYIQYDGNKGVLQAGRAICQKVTLQAPANGSLTEPVPTTFQWSAMPNAIWYRLQIATDSQFTNMVVNDSTTATTKQISTLLTNTQYFWRVKASKSYGASYTDPWTFTTMAPDTLDINLTQGWNMISSNVIPSNPSIVAIFAPIASNVKIVKSGIGQMYIPQFGINTIGNWNINNGYLVNMTAPATLTIMGAKAVPQVTPINLTQGWNLVSYLRDSPMPIENALVSITSNLVIAKNLTGGLYIPSLNLNTIGDMNPGMGYWLYLSAPSVLLYPAN